MAYQAPVEGQSVVEGFTLPLRTVVRPVRVDAPQVSDASLAEAVVALEGDRVPGLLVAQRAPGRGTLRCSHVVVVAFGSSCLRDNAHQGAGPECLNPAHQGRGQRV